MTAVQYLSATIVGLVITACAGMHTAPPNPQQVLAPAGRLRIGVYVDSPISPLRDRATGVTRAGLRGASAESLGGDVQK